MNNTNVISSSSAELPACVALHYFTQLAASVLERDHQSANSIFKLTLYESSRLCGVAQHGEASTKLVVMLHSSPQVDVCVAGHSISS